MKSLLTAGKRLWENKKVQNGVKVGAVALVCLLALLYGIFRTMTIDPYGTQYTPDEKNYINMAKTLLTEHYYSYWGGIPDAYVSPGFPLFLTGWMAIFGTGTDGLLCIKLVQCVLSAGTVALTFLLGKLLTEKYSVGLIACILVALNGQFYFFARKLLTESLYFFTMMVFFVLFVLAVKKDRGWLYLAAGVAFAVTVMVRSLVLVVAPFAFLPLIVKRWKKWRAVLLPIALFAAGFLVICIPWWVRNWVTLHKTVLFASQTNPIYAGLAPNIEELGIKNPRTIFGNLALLFQLLLQDFKGIFYWLTLEKFRIIFMGDITLCSYPAITVLVRNVTLYLGLFGGLRVLFTRKGWGPALVFWIYFLSTFLFVPTSRYALQYMPLLAILAGWLLARLFSRERKPERETGEIPEITA